VAALRSAGAEAVLAGSGDVIVKCVKRTTA